MARIKSSLKGVVYAFRPNGDVVPLRAGEEVPADIALGSHLVEADAPAKPVAPAVEADTAEAKPAPARRGRPRSTPKAPGATDDGASD